MMSNFTLPEEEGTLILRPGPSAASNSVCVILNIFPIIYCHLAMKLFNCTGKHVSSSFYTCTRSIYPFVNLQLVPLL